MNKNKLTTALHRANVKTRQELVKRWGQSEAASANMTDIIQEPIVVTDELIAIIAKAFGPLCNLRRLNAFEIRELVSTKVAPIHFEFEGRALCYEPSVEILETCEQVIGPNWHLLPREAVARLLAPHIARTWPPKHKKAPWESGAR